MTGHVLADLAVGLFLLREMSAAEAYMGKDGTRDRRCFSNNV